MICPNCGSARPKPEERVFLRVNTYHGRRGINACQYSCCECGCRFVLLDQGQQKKHHLIATIVDMEGN